ncbi:type II toxin-antitoxin system RelE/ParE family toxin [Flavobacterium sp. LS2P90]|uniref:Type II toxin-antitoxin system RelE/ParE family toxin n=1 Tax=Flavobacterium xylosi TaxID=3230415 RepID=A0ABW6HYC9_9FLAO
MKVFWSKTALSQLKTIAYHNPFCSPKNLSDKIFKRTILLKKFPEMGSLQKFTKNTKIYKTHKYRYLVEGNYKILYYISENNIRISLVFHTSQEPEKLSQFLENDL